MKRMLKKTFIILSICFLMITAFSAASTEAFAQSRKDKRQAEKLFREGSGFYRQNDFKAAIDRYAQAITLYPGFAEAHFWKGYTHYRLNQPDQAIYDLDAAQRLGFAPLEVYKIRWFLHYQKQNFSDALRDAQAGLKLMPGNPFFMLAVGDVYRASKDHESALAYYEQALPMDPNNADLPYFMAASYNAVGNYENQLRAAQAALRKGTKFPGEAWYLVADAFLRQGDLLQAVEAFERAIIANDNIYEAYNNLSEIYRAAGDYPKAIATMEKALKAFENDGGFLINLTWYHSLAGNTGEAIREGQRAVKHASDNYMSYTNLCRAYNDIGQHNQALEHCEKALTLKPGDGETHYYMGRAYDKLGRTDQATTEFKKAVTGLEDFTRQSPYYADGFYLLAGAYYADNQRDKAIEAYKKTLELSPRFARAHYNLAYLYHLKGDKAAAKRQSGLLRQIDPELANRLDEAIK